LIFEEDALLLQLFETYQGDEEELEKAILKYCKGNQIDPTVKARQQELLAVNT
jgi:hypothetical protein